MERDFELTSIRRYLESKEGWRVFEQLPRIELPNDIAMQMMPPSGGAVARIVLWKGDRRLSIYFDALDRLGAVDQPYYELYPNIDDDTSRYLIGEESQMAEEIAAIFSAVPKES